MADTVTSTVSHSEDDARPAPFSERATPPERAVPARKSLPWDQCSAIDLSEIPRCDFHELSTNKIRRTGEQ